MPGTLSERSPSPLQLRAELEAMVRRDLLGPAGESDEEVDERAVCGRYILGLLAPRGLRHDSTTSRRACSSGSVRRRGARRWI